MNIRVKFRRLSSGSSGGAVSTSSPDGQLGSGLRGSRRTTVVLTGGHLPAGLDLIFS
jgi:hypothetical protein